MKQLKMECCFGTNGRPLGAHGELRSPLSLATLVMNSPLRGFTISELLVALKTQENDAA